jgi:hypothetical protein
MINKAAAREEDSPVRMTEMITRKSKEVTAESAFVQVIRDCSLHYSLFLLYDFILARSSWPRSREIHQKSDKKLLLLRNSPRECTSLYAMRASNKGQEEASKNLKLGEIASRRIREEMNEQRKRKRSG